MVKRISARDARASFSDLMGSVHYSREPVIVEKQGRPFVVVISPEDYERFLKDWDTDFAVLDEIWARNPDMSAEEAEVDAAREIGDSRAERRAEFRGRRD